MQCAPQSAAGFNKTAVTPLSCCGYNAADHAVLQQHREQGAPLAQQAGVKGADREAGVDAELVEVGGADQAARLAKLGQDLPLKAKVGGFEPAGGQQGGQGEPQAGGLEVLLHLTSSRAELGDGVGVHGKVEQL